MTDEEQGQAYMLAGDSEFSSVEVDDKTLEKDRGAVVLTQDQYDRVTATEGVKLVKAEESATTESSDTTESPDATGEETGEE